MTSIQTRFTAIVALAVSALAGCGGGTADGGSMPQRSAQTTAPLFDDAGQPRLSPMHLVPADTAARTRNGLYVTRAQYEWQELVSMPTTVLIDVDLLGSAAAAVRRAEQVRQGYRDPGLSYFVRSRRAAAAAEVVNRLVDQGFAPVFLVV